MTNLHYEIPSSPFVSPVKALDVSKPVERSLFLERYLPRKVSRFASGEPPPFKFRFGVEDASSNLGDRLLALRFTETEDPFGFDDT